MARRAPSLHTGQLLAGPGARGPRWLLALALSSCGGGADDPANASGSCPDDLPSREVCAGPIPSYGSEVAPIIEERCNDCHYSGNRLSSVSLATLDEVYARRQTVQSRIYACVMPPELAPALTPLERATLLAWLVCGAPAE